MPIGKNSIKRVKDGYSNVKTAAPDMQNSTVLAAPAPEVIEKLVPGSESPSPKARGRKPSSKNAPKVAEAKPTPAAKEKNIAEVKASDEKKRNGFEKFALGDDMPTYLL